MDSIRSICVVGSGFMGWQIGLQCASYAYPVLIYDIYKEALIRAYGNISSELDSRILKGVLTVEEKDSILSRISMSENLSAVSGGDLVIEATTERLEIKRKVFRDLDSICNRDTILATNSSSIRVSKIESVTSRGDRVLNTHFYSNPWSSKIVELMRGTITSDETINRTRDFMISIGMIPLTVLKESTGFIFNRVWRSVKKESLRLVDDGVATFEDVDRAWMSLYERNMGPFGMMDQVGLDVVKDIEMVYYEESGDPRDAPPRLLLDKVEKGMLGVKTGKGFYTYPNPAFREPGWLYKGAKYSSN